MSVIRYEYTVQLEDGDPIDVVADQRDVARFEVQPFGCAWSEVSGRLHTAMRFTAWSAMFRQGMTKLSWAKFDEQCIEVTDLKRPDDDEDQGDEVIDQVDPGPAGQPAEPLSTSRAPRASRSATSSRRGKRGTSQP